MTIPYRPGNGSEGADFQHRFCDRCEHDAAFQRGEGDGCEILSRALRYLEDDPRFPVEWVCDDDDVTGETARCTGFQEVTWDT